MDEVPESELEKAAEAGDLVRLRQLVTGGDFDAASETASTAACVAAAHGHWDCVHFFVEDAGISLGGEAAGGVLLQQAAVVGRLDTMKLLLRHGATLRGRAGAGVLLSSAATGKLEILRFALESGVDVAEHGSEAALSAARRASWPAVEILIGSGLNLAEGGLGVQLLALVASQGQAALAQELEARGISTTSPQAILALKALASTQTWDTSAGAICFLVDRGVDTCSDAGQEALVTAAVRGDLDTVKLLVRSGVPVNGAAGGRALERAGELGPPETSKQVSEYLQRCGAILPEPVPLILDEDF